MLNIVAQALADYRHDAALIFAEETDEVQDIAEDVLREAIDAMGLSEMHERLYGKVDLKKAIYVFAPNAESVALMLDAKAEEGDVRTATIQMSQTSMMVRMRRKGEEVGVPGGLGHFITRNGRKLLVVTVVAKFVYTGKSSPRSLNRIIVASIPNGLLQDRYNPAVDDGIWLVGRDASTLGEDFRVRLSYQKLADKAAWRIIEIDPKDQK